MAFPSVQGTITATNGTAATTTPVVSLPGSIQSGELLIVLIRSASSTGITWTGSGFTELVDDTSDASNDATAIGYRWADGTEGVSITLGSDSARFAAISLRISGAINPATQAPQLSTVAIGTDNLPNPTTCTPTGGSKDYLWLWLGGWDGEQDSPPASNPSGYSNPTGANTGTSGLPGTNCRVAIATKAANAASEDPGNWQLSASANLGWTAWCMAVHPAPAAQNLTATPASADHDAVSTMTRFTLAALTATVATFTSSSVDATPIPGLSAVNAPVASAVLDAPTATSATEVFLNAAVSSVAWDTSAAEVFQILALTGNPAGVASDVVAETVVPGATFASADPASVTSDAVAATAVPGIVAIPATTATTDSNVPTASYIPGTAARSATPAESEAVATPGTEIVAEGGIQVVQANPAVVDAASVPSSVVGFVALVAPVASTESDSPWAVGFSEIALVAPVASTESDSPWAVGFAEAPPAPPVIVGPFDALADTVLQVGISTFGESVTYTPIDGDPFSITGVFDAGHEEVSLGGVPVSSVHPVLGVRLAEFPPGSPLSGDTVVIDGSTYTIVDVQQDGHGGALLRLLLSIGNGAQIESFVMTALLACLDVFGQVIFYTPQSTGIPVSVTGIFDSAHEQVVVEVETGMGELARLLRGFEVETGLPVSTRRPILGVRLTDFAVTPKIGDTAIIAGERYGVVDVQRDGQGGAVLRLVKT